jgi:hypothetical protein
VKVVGSCTSAVLDKRTSSMIGEVVDHAEARARADQLAADPKVKAWLRRARKLFKDLPEGTWVYWACNNFNLMALAPDGSKYVNSANMTRGSDGNDRGAVVALINVPGSDCGDW